MNKITTVSWPVFFIILGALFVLWMVSTRTRFGRTIIRRETPWDIKQWTTLLIIIATTVFILINPLFHLMTAAIVAGLYYIFISRDALGRKINYSGKGVDVLSPTIDFSTKPEETYELKCIPKESKGDLMDLRSIERCIFSFPMVAENPHPKIDFIKGIYHIKARLSSGEYLSSLITYVEQSGFEVEYKI